MGADCATIAYVARDGNRPYYYANAHHLDRVPLDPRDMALIDGRRAGTQLDREGFACLPHASAIGDFTDRDAVAAVYPDEIVQTPGQVTLFMNNTNPVMIWTDGRPHPRDLPLSYNGHSIGYWVGNTLFVDTVGLVPTTTIDSVRDPHGTQLHIRWSIEKVGPDILHLHVTLYDADAFLEPVTTTNIWHRKTDPKWQVLDDASCWENNESKTDTVPDGGFFKF